MGHYLISFSIYTMAMLGIIFIALFTFKACVNGSFSKKSSMLNIVDTMKLSARKTLYVVKAGGENFLIAADTDKTALISKLESQTNPIKLQQEKEPRKDKSIHLKSFDGLESLNEFSSVIDFNREKTKKGPMMKELARKLQTVNGK